MPRRKRKVRSSKTRKKTNVVRSFFIGAEIGIILLILSLFVLTLFNFFSHKDQKVVMESAKEIIIPTPTLIPSPIPTQKAKTPSGFCLNVPVLLYHHIQPFLEAKKEGHTQLTVDTSWFDKQLSYLKQTGYNAISADQLIQALISHQSLPGKNILITLDDGYSDVYNYAYPMAKKYNLVLNLMIPTGLLGNTGYITWDQLKEMVGSGLVAAFNHTWSHASLGRASLAKIQQEILTANKQLEENNIKSGNIFTYPYGSENNTVVNFLRANGFIAAFSTIPGFLQCDSYIMSLHRNHIGNAPLSSYGL